MKEFLAKLNKKEKYMIGNQFFSFFIMGVYVIMIGSILPMMREDYGLSYAVIGLIAGAAGMKMGMNSVLIPAVLLVIAAFINCRFFTKKHE